MKTSKEELLKEARIAKFRPEILEKVWFLLEILEEINTHPFLHNKVALKGGTALNLFYFDMPRLSIDIDLNYIGSLELSNMILERPLVEKNLEAVFSKVGLSIIRVPQKHAGGKWQLKYPSYLGGSGNLEVDLNFMFRLPLHDQVKQHSRSVGNRQAQNIALISYYEIAAGKLTALFARHASRDLFDAYHLLTDDRLDFKLLRLIFCVYGAMSSIDWRTISLDHIAFEPKELSQKLIPVLRIDLNPQWLNNCSTFIEKCKEILAQFYPFTEREIQFFDLLYTEGKIDASLLTDDPVFIEKIQNQPLLKWKAQLAKQNQLTF